MSNRIRVMIVDDEPDLRSIHRLLLQREYDVVEAENGLDALTKLDRYEPDLLLIDVMMPLMDGWDLAKSVRQNDRFSGIPIMYLTSLSSRDDMRKGYESGANVYLTKPVDPDRLHRNIQVFIDQGDLRPAPKRFSLDALARDEAAEGERIAAHSAQRARDARESHEQKPRAPGPADESEPQPPSTFEAAHDRPLPRLLALDDDPRTCESLAEWAGTGFEVIATTRAIHFLRKTPQYEPDVFMIGGKSTVNAPQVLNILRKCQATAMSPVLFVVNKAEQRLINYALTQGADLVLSRPLNPVEVKMQLKRIVARVGFRVRSPKSLSLNQIREMEQLEAEARSEEEEHREAHEAHGAQRDEKPSPEKDTATRLREFYREHRENEPEE